MERREEEEEGKGEGSLEVEEGEGKEVREERMVRSRRNQDEDVVLLFVCHPMDSLVSDQHLLPLLLPPLPHQLMAAVPQVKWMVQFLVLLVHLMVRAVVKKETI